MRAHLCARERYVIEYGRSQAWDTITRGQVGAHRGAEAARATWQRGAHCTLRYCSPFSDRRLVCAPNYYFVFSYKLRSLYLGTSELAVRHARDVCPLPRLCNRLHAPCLFRASRAPRLSSAGGTAAAAGARPPGAGAPGPTCSSRHRPAGGSQRQESTFVLPSAGCDTN